MAVPPENNEPPRICNYEGSDYQARFWGDQKRSYEDRVERIALRRLMPPKGDTLIDIGAGFGRLGSEYAGYKRIVLFDYSRTLLREAQTHWGDDPRFLYVAGNWYQMPFVAGLFDTLIQVRTIHHAADVPALFAQLMKIARPGGDYVLEFANKHNVKAIVRHRLGRQLWSPSDLEPIEFAEMNFDFHPRWMRDQLDAAGFIPGRMLSVSHFRIGLLKKVVPTAVLAGLDGLIQGIGSWLQLSPSIFIHNQVPVTGTAAAPDAFFACPHCGTPLGEVEEVQLHCSNPDCGRKWAVVDGLYDFKQPLDAPHFPE
ncbi:MAG: methyltransferase domain-containing protein [Candidatus Promineifilaceae bacterium]